MNLLQRKELYGAQYNGLEFQKTLLQRAIPAAQQNGLNYKNLIHHAIPNFKRQKKEAHSPAGLPYVFIYLIKCLISS